MDVSHVNFEIRKSVHPMHSRRPNARQSHGGWQTKCKEWEVCQTYEAKQASDIWFISWFPIKLLSYVCLYCFANLSSETSWLWQTHETIAEIETRWDCAGWSLHDQATLSKPALTKESTISDKFQTLAEEAVQKFWKSPRAPRYKDRNYHRYNEAFAPTDL